MKLSGMTAGDELLAEQLRTDSEFRAHWERTTLARAVAVAMVRYRAQHNLSQRALAERLGVKQPQVARLELGDVNPSIETLMRISAQLGIETTIDVRPAGAVLRDLDNSAHCTCVVGEFRTDRAELCVAVRIARAAVQARSDALPGRPGPILHEPLA